MQQFNASEFKAKCLAILDEVYRTGEAVIILKRGRPVAQLVPAMKVKSKYPQSALLGSVKIVGDVIEPVIAAGEWEAERPSKK